MKQARAVGAVGVFLFACGSSSPAAIAPDTVAIPTPSAGAARQDTAAKESVPAVQKEGASEIAFADGEYEAREYEPNDGGPPRRIGPTYTGYTISITTDSRGARHASVVIEPQYRASGIQSATIVASLKEDSNGTAFYFEREELASDAGAPRARFKQGDKLFTLSRAVDDRTLEFNGSLQPYYKERIDALVKAGKFKGERPTSLVVFAKAALGTVHLPTKLKGGRPY